MKNNLIRSFVFLTAALAGMSILTAKAASCDEVSDFAIGVEFGGRALRLARYENGKIADIDVPIEFAHGFADRFTRGEPVTVDDAKEIRRLLPEDAVANAMLEIVIALPHDVAIEVKAAISEAFYKSGMKIRRCIDRTTAYAFDYMVLHPSIDARLRIEDIGGGEVGVSVVNMGSGVCEVEDVGTNLSVPNDTSIRTIKIDEDGLGIVHGVAMYAAVLKRKFDDGLILDVVGREIGIVNGDRSKFLPLIERNVTIPAKRSIVIPDEFSSGAKRLSWLDRQGNSHEIMVGEPFYLLATGSGHKVTIDIDADHNISVENVLVNAFGVGGLHVCKVDYMTGRVRYELLVDDAAKTASSHDGFGETSDTNGLLSNLKGNAGCTEEREKSENATKKIIWGVIILVIGWNLGKGIKNKSKVNKNISKNERNEAAKVKRNWFATIIGIITALLAYAFVRGLVSSWLSK